MVAISDQVFFVNQEIVVCIQLPKFAVYHIEMLIRKVSAEIQNFSTVKR